MQQWSKYPDSEQPSQSYLLGIMLGNVQSTILSIVTLNKTQVYFKLHFLQYSLSVMLDYGTLENVKQKFEYAWGMSHAKRFPSWAFHNSCGFFLEQNLTITLRLQNALFNPEIIVSCAIAARSFHPSDN